MDRVQQSTKIRIIFVCHGNICRSPMAEFVFRNMIESAGLADKVVVSSAATSTEEIGNPVYPMAKRELAKHGIGCEGKTARQLTLQMYDESDYVIGMDDWNIGNIRRIAANRPLDKVSRLLDFVKTGDTFLSREIDDPWYTRDFKKAYAEIELGCRALLEHIQSTLAVKD